MKRLQVILVLFLVLPSPRSIAQPSAAFDISQYQQFLDRHSNLGVQEFQAMYPAGGFLAAVPAPGAAYAYLDSIELKFGLTAHEKELLAKHGFVVTSRLAESTMGEAVIRVFNADLPVYVSTDAILQAVHASYDRILMDSEKHVLIPALTNMLTAMHTSLGTLEQRYVSSGSMRPMLRDVDVYLTVPLMLLGGLTGPRYPENAPMVNQTLSAIMTAQPTDLALFADTPRKVDFSQFTVRGHYTRDSSLARYFRAMMWLGRTELFLIAPSGTTTTWPEEDIRRQAVDAFLLMEALRAGRAEQLLGRMDSIIALLVGEQDNVTPGMLDSLGSLAGISMASDLLEPDVFHGFQETLRSNGFAFQRINSQILMSDPMDPARLTPASAFFLLGQRFIIDSYITANVVYDRILVDGRKVTRMLPSTLDVLFSLGNDGAGRLLEPELQRYRYGANLAALRYLVDSYGPDFWRASVFNSWLDMIRALNPPGDRSALPGFMQTAAWWQYKMNTQLASWSQLRHDNLLYAKQSYTGGIICSFPESYVEPVPPFYDRLKDFAAAASERLPAAGIPWVREYFEHMSGVADTLGMIARKQLAGVSLNEAERTFLRSMVVVAGVCGLEYTGWYPRLHYDSDLFYGREALKAGLVVADVHTAPTDEIGTTVGWVVHAGTGPVDMAVLLAKSSDGRPFAFVGPVFSYFEHVTADFRRLTDEEWVNVYNTPPSFRPDFVNLYLADDRGQSRGSGASLLSSADTPPGPGVPATAHLAQNFPNPFNSSTVIPFVIPSVASASRVRLAVYDLTGRLVSTLLDAVLPGGAYTVRWNGRNDSGVAAATGVYFCSLDVAGVMQSKRMALLR